jgi:hypothetical protein
MISHSEEDCENPLTLEEVKGKTLRGDCSMVAQRCGEIRCVTIYSTIALLACVLTAVGLAIALSIAVARYTEASVNKDALFDTASDASAHLKVIARWHLENLKDISGKFVTALRQKYDERQSQNDDDYWYDGYYDDDVDDEYHHIDFKDGSTLPPICPALEDHLRIVFNLKEHAFDPFGLPCAMEMHWSASVNAQELYYDNSAFMDSLDNKIGSDRFTTPFRSIVCSRRYKMRGFTKWSCEEYPKLPTKNSIVYKIGCFDIDTDGTVQLKAPDSRGLPVDAHGRVKTTPGGTSPVLNPAYDKDLQHIERGHYCYINYAVAENGEWRSVMNLSVSTFISSFIVVSVVICCVSTSVGVMFSSAVFCVITTLVSSWVYVYLSKETYIHDGVLDFIHYLLFLIHIGAGFLYLIYIFFECVYKSKFTVGRCCTKNHPLIVKIINSIAEANNCGPLLPDDRDPRGLYSRSMPRNESCVDSITNLLIPSDKTHRSRHKERYDMEMHYGYDEEGNAYEILETGVAVSRDPVSIVTPSDRYYHGTISKDSQLNMGWCGTEERTQMYTDAKQKAKNLETEKDLPDPDEEEKKDLDKIE